MGVCCSTPAAHGDPPAPEPRAAELTEDEVFAAVMASPAGRRMAQREGYAQWLRQGDAGHTPGPHSWQVPTPSQLHSGLKPPAPAKNTVSPIPEDRPTLAGGA